MVFRITARSRERAPAGLSGGNAPRNFEAPRARRIVQSLKIPHCQICARLPRTSQAVVLAPKLRFLYNDPIGRGAFPLRAERGAKQPAPSLSSSPLADFLRSTLSWARCFQIRLRQRRPPGSDRPRAARPDTAKPIRPANSDFRKYSLTTASLSSGRFRNGLVDLGIMTPRRIAGDMHWFSVQRRSGRVECQRCGRKRARASRPGFEIAGARLRVSTTIRYLNTRRAARRGASSSAPLRICAGWARFRWGAPSPTRAAPALSLPRLSGRRRGCPPSGAP